MSKIVTNGIIDHLIKHDKKTVICIQVKDMTAQRIFNIMAHEWDQEALKDFIPGAPVHITIYAESNTEK